MFQRLRFHVISIGQQKCFDMKHQEFELKIPLIFQKCSGGRTRYNKPLTFNKSRLYDIAGKKQRLGLCRTIVAVITNSRWR